MLGLTQAIPLNVLVTTGGGGDGYFMGLENQMPFGKIGAKKQKRLEMKEEKKLLREV